MNINEYNILQVKCLKICKSVSYFFLSQVLRYSTDTSTREQDILPTLVDSSTTEPTDDQETECNISHVSEYSLTLKLNIVHY